MGIDFIRFEYRGFLVLVLSVGSLCSYFWAPYRPEFSWDWLDTTNSVGVSSAQHRASAMNGRECETTDTLEADAPRTDADDLQVIDQGLVNELRNCVTQLSEKIGERNLAHYKNLQASDRYLRSQFRKFGYKVSHQKFEVKGLDCFNVIAERTGGKKKDEILIVGAHYDSARGTPGANDNATGVAAMLALAKKFSKSKCDRTIRFVAFTNEEPPYFQNRGEMGSWVYAEKCRTEKESISGVLSLETMGYFSDEKNSQNYPSPLDLLYPSTGNFIGFVGDPKSSPLLFRAVKTFRKNSDVPSEYASLPRAVQGVGWSDHWSFWQEGFQGIMVTDTAPFRYPHYHRATDTIDKVDFKTLSRVVLGLEHVVRDLATVQEKKDRK